MNYQVFCNNREVSVRSAAVFPRPYNTNQAAEYVMFPIEGKTQIRIISKIPVHSAVIRPLKSGIVPEIKDNEISFTIDKPQKLSVEINGGFYNNIMIFTHKEEPVKKSENIITIKKGEVFKGMLKIDKDDTTVIIEDGGVIDGNIYAEYCENLTICGFGRICMENYSYEMRKDFARSIDIFKCKNVNIQDIIIDDSNDWSLRINGCDNVKIHNVKIFGCRGNSDGIDVCGSRNVEVYDIFTRVWDDSFVVKALDTGNVENILFRDSVLWNDFARPIEVGVELRADVVKNVKFQNIDVIHSTTGYPIMGIHHGDRAKVSDIVFDNIRIEDAPGAQLFDLRITNSVWNRDNKMGNIRSVTFSNINYIGADDNILLSKSRVEGYDEEHNIKNVSFKNIAVNGKTADSAKTLGLDIRNFADDVFVTADSDAKKIAVVNSAIRGEFTPNKNGGYSAFVTAELVNHNAERMTGKAIMAIAPKNTAEEREFYYDLMPGEKSEYKFNFNLQPGKYVFFFKDGGYTIENNRYYAALDVLAAEDIENAPFYEFVNYYGDRKAAVRFAVSGGNLNLESKTDGDFVLYTAEPVPERDGEALFSVEETDFGEISAVVRDGDDTADAPQLRCPAEITYVFKNEPKVKEIVITPITLKSGEAKQIPLENLGINPLSDKFILDIEAKTGYTANYRYPYTLFHSTMPAKTAHMFGKIIVNKER